MSLKRISNRYNKLQNVLITFMVPHVIFVVDSVTMEIRVINVMEFAKMAV